MKYAGKTKPPPPCRSETSVGAIAPLVVKLACAPAGTVTEKLLTYALGRGLEFYDMPVVRGIVRDAARNDYEFSSLITGIVKSTPFQMRKAAGRESN